MEKYLVLAASIAIQICLGGIYAWSEFVHPLNESYGLTATQTQLIFGFTIAIFTLSMIPAGKFLEKYGPRIVATIGGVMFALGYVIASFSGGSFWLLLLGIAVTSGIGIGFGYICPIATSIKWFPNNKGMITGLAVAGFGGGAIILSTIANKLLLEGVSVLTVFLLIGIIYGLIIIASASRLSVPRDMEEAGKRGLSRQDVQTVNIFRDKQFWSLSLAMFAGTFAGLMIIGSLKAIALDFGVEYESAVYSISAFAVGNSVGRITWGWLYDKIGRITLPSSLLLLAVAIICLILLGNMGWLFIIVSALIGFGFGSCFVLYAAQVGTTYGTELVGRVYPYIFLFYGISGIFGPTVGGWLFDLSGNYIYALWFSVFVVGLGVVGLIKKQESVRKCLLK